jgi:outer membrane protein OmpA-like peptidoglycan-associated protein
LLLGNVYFANGASERGISISHRDKNGNWQFPEKQVIEDFYNTSPYAEFSMSANRKILMMAIERNDTYGARDLYVSFLKSDGIWSLPKNIGKQINSAEEESTPFLAADDKTLYFASSGHPGFGSMDIYVTKRLDDSWQNWSVPINLGSEINSEFWESAYSTDAAGEYVYFVSTKNSVNKSADICRAKPATETKPEPVVLLSGTVYNAKTKEPLGADIIYETLSDGKEIGLASSDSKTGLYKIVLPYRKKYGLWAKTKGFLSVNENIDLEMFDSFKEIVMDLYLVPIEVGSVMVINNLFFKQGTADILLESITELERIAALMNENPNMEVELGGHTDIEGIPAQNFKLSHGRVEAVKSFLVKKGVAPERIQTKAYGQTMPLTRARDEESKKKNRRVEFTVLKN